MSINPVPGGLSCPPSLHSGLGSAWLLLLLRAHPLGQAATTKHGLQSDCGHQTSTLAQMGTALRPHRKGTGLWGQDTGWVRQQNPGRRFLEHISTSSPHGWGCLPQTLSLTCDVTTSSSPKMGQDFLKRKEERRKTGPLNALLLLRLGKL